MIKSTGVRIAVKLLLILLIINIYFYFQHPVLYRCTNLSAVVPIGDMKLVIDDIIISNLDEDKLSNLTLQGEFPWIYRKIMEKDLPMELTLDLFKIASFYTRKPLTNEYANIKLSGTLIYPAEIRNFQITEGKEIMDRFEIGISPGYFSGRSCTKDDGCNYCTWQSYGTCSLDDLNKEITLAITDQATNKVSYIYFTPRWKKERIMQGHISIRDADPAQPVQDYINRISHNNTQAALEYIVHEKRSDFESHRLNNEFKNADIRYTVDWDDCLAEYSGAYRVTAEPGKYQNENQSDFVAAKDNRLIFYTVKESDGKFYIVLTQ